MFFFSENLRDSLGCWCLLGIGGQSHVFVSWKLICHKMSYSVFVQIMFHAWACGRWCGAEKIFNLVFFRVEFFEDIYFNIFSDWKSSKTTVLPNLKFLWIILSYFWWKVSFFRFVEVFSNQLQLVTLTSKSLFVCLDSWMGLDNFLCNLILCSTHSRDKRQYNNPFTLESFKLQS